MNACIGWEADAPCPVYGQWHGCKFEDGHNVGGGHVCACGATTRTRDLPIERAFTRVRTRAG